MTTDAAITPSCPPGPLVACCLDDDPAGLLSLTAARRLWGGSARLVLVHAGPRPLLVDTVDGVTVTRDEDLNAHERRWLAGVARREEVADTVFLEGLPGPAICAWAASAAPDVVVVGSHGRGSLGRALMGSVARHVVGHCTRPVLLVPAPRTEVSP